MSEQPPSPEVEPGWYRDPGQAHTQRYWDGEDWTDQRAPLPEQSAEGWLDAKGRLTYRGNFAIGLIVAGIGAAIAIVGCFLPLADTESSVHIAQNSLMAHWEGPVVIGVALVGFLAAFSPPWRPVTFFAGAALIGVAVIAGTHLPIHYRNRFSENVAGHASVGAGVWTVGIGGVVLAIAAYFTDWHSSSGTDDPDAEGERWMPRWEELMSGRRHEVDDEGDSMGETE